MKNLTYLSTMLAILKVLEVLTPHVPISIADINDNDNFHQLCFSTSDKIVKVSMAANTVEDPNT